MKKVFTFVLAVSLLLPGCAQQIEETAISPDLNDPTINQTKHPAEGDGRSQAEVPRGKPDFENSYWGDHLEQVLENERIEGLEHVGIWSQTEFAGYGAMAFFNVQDGVLSAGFYRLLYPYGEAEDAYKTAKENLAELYGEPIQESSITILDAVGTDNPVVTTWQLDKDELGNARTLVYLTFNGRHGAIDVTFVDRVSKQR